MSAPDAGTLEGIEKRLQQLVEYHEQSRNNDLARNASMAAHVEDHAGHVDKTAKRDKAALIDKRDVTAILGELVATMLFLFIGLGSAMANGFGGNPGHLLPSFAFGIGIAVLAYCFGPISGAHINPAVTLAVALNGKIKPLVAVLYVVAQLCGAVIGSAVVLGGLPGASDGAARDMLRGGVNMVATSRGVTEGDGFLYECFGTFLLVFTVLRTAVDSQGNDATGNLTPLAIGLSVFLAHLVLIPFTNCSINPARSFGASAVANKWDHHYIFWAGPIVGSLFATLVFKVLFHHPHPEKEGGDSVAVVVDTKADPKAVADPTAPDDA